MHPLDTLDRVLQERIRQLPENSYVSALVNQGQDAILQKVGEETTEFILAAKNARNLRTPPNHARSDADLPTDQGSAEAEQAVVHELTDLLFHCMVALADLDISFDQIIEEIERRNVSR